MRPKDIISRLLDEDVSPETLADLKPNEGKTYKELGFPQQGLASYLSRRGILKPSKNSARSRCTVWVRGVHFDRFLDYWLQNRSRYCKPFAVSPDCGQKVAV
jgi:hypothetical protein